MTPERRYEIEHTTEAEQKMLRKMYLETGQVCAVVREVTADELRELYPSSEQGK